MPLTLITGCSSGIGLALARAFKQAGHEVWATARKTADVERLASQGFVARALDVNDDVAVAALAAELPRLDVLVNNAGYGAMGPLLDGGVAGIRQQFETNVFSIIGVTRALFPHLRASRGLVVNIGSVSGVLVTPFAGAYCASKAAVHGLSDALRMELAPFGIRVMEVQPGAIDTQFASNASREAEAVIAEDSPWWPLQAQIRARAKASQDRPTPAADFARQLLAAVHKPVPPRLVRIGNGCRALPFLERWMPKAIVEGLLKRKFGLNRGL